MNVTDLAPILIKEGAPIIASYLGTPLAGLVVSLIANHFGLPKDAKVDDIAKGIADNPLHVRSLEFEHRERLAHYFVEIVEASTKSDLKWNVVILILVVVVVVFGYLLIDLYLS